MTGIRPMIDAAVAQAIAEHPKYFTELALDNNRARTAIVRKIWAALRGDGAERGDGDSAAAPGPAVPPPPQHLSARPDSREAKGYANLRRLAGAPPQFRAGDGSVFINADANSEAVFALETLPDESHWKFYSGRNASAWLEFFGEKLPGITRKDIRQRRGDLTGIVMPYPWPPSKDGKIYHADEDAA